MRIGDSGKQVEDLQVSLKTLGIYRWTIDGDFGPRTKQAVVDFQQAYLVDGIVDKVTADAIKAAVVAWSGQDQVVILPLPDGMTELERQFGHIEYEDTAAGAVRITNGWDQENIVLADLPVVGRHYIHRKMEPVFAAVMDAIKARGLDKEIVQFGTWSPRHKMHDPARGLSTHSWGIACDINWAANPVGAVGDMHPGIVEVFEQHGFEWGGRWRTRDDMHYQYVTGW